MSNSDTVTTTKTTTTIQEPPMFKVIYHNDSTTSMEFVVETLMNFFDYNSETAFKITQDIHELGSAVVAVLPYELAEQKGIEVTVCARSNNYPLQVKLEPETT